MALYWMALFTSFIATSFGQVAYKYYAHSKLFPHLIISILFFAIAPISSYIALREIQIDVVFIGAAFSQVIIMLLSRWILKENITRDHFISMTLISIGLIIYSLGN